MSNASNSRSKTKPRTSASASARAKTKLRTLPKRITSNLPLPTPKIEEEEVTPVAIRRPNRPSDTPKSPLPYPPDSVKREDEIPQGVGKVLRRPSQASNSGTRKPLSTPSLLQSYEEAEPLRKPFDDPEFGNVLRAKRPSSPPSSPSPKKESKKSPSWVQAATYLVGIVASLSTLMTLGTHIPSIETGRAGIEKEGRGLAAHTAPSSNKGTQYYDRGEVLSSSKTETVLRVFNLDNSVDRTLIVSGYHPVGQALAGVTVKNGRLTGSKPWHPTP